MATSVTVETDRLVDRTRRTGIDIKLLDTSPRRRRRRRPVIDIETAHLDRGYDFPAVRRQLTEQDGLTDTSIQRRKRPGGKRPQPMRLGLRWIVEATNS